ncbi:MAG: hypothetical protein ABEI27_01540 [Halobellus sp.]|uniref:hypothetical protein n=1 Tax=Halobellus sp. TaxID=1979212 RepID=UPI0035D4CDC6
MPDRTPQDANLQQQNRPITNYELTRVRNESRAALIAGDSESERSRFYEHLTDAESVPTFSDVAEADELARFIGETDFESKSVLLLVRPIPECYELRLTGVSKEGDGVDSQYCRDMRPADVQCKKDAEDTVGVAIRLPLAGDSFNSLGMGFGSSCDDRPSMVHFEPVTPTSNATTTSTAETGGGSE